MAILNGKFIHCNLFITFAVPLKHQDEMKQISYDAEIYRKLIHLSSLWIPFLALNVSRNNFLLIIIGLAVTAVVADFSRAQFPAFNRFIQHFFGTLLRSEEKRQAGGSFINGSTWVLGAAALVFAFFELKIAVVAITTLLIGDAFAALIGRRFGKTKIYKDKSLEGGLAFFVFSFFGLISLFPVLPIQLLLLAALMGAILELIEIPYLNDNLVIPLGISTILTIINLF